MNTTLKEFIYEETIEEILYYKVCEEQYDSYIRSQLHHKEQKILIFSQ